MAKAMVWLSGAVLLTLAGLNALVASSADTCTQGAADSLLGGVLTLGLYVVGVTLVGFAPRRRAWWLLLLPALAGLTYQIYFSVRLFAGVMLSGMTACDVFTGADSFNMDGRESFFAFLWLGTSLLASAGLIWAWKRAGRG